MSVNVGVEDNFVDTQKVVLENVTDGLIYDQALTVDSLLFYNTKKTHQLTNDTVEKTFSITDKTVNVNILVTQPELAALLTLATPVGAVLTRKQWDVHLTDQSNNMTTITGSAALSTLEIIDPGVGLATIKLTLEYDFDPAVVFVEAKK